MRKACIQVLALLLAAVSLGAATEVDVESAHRDAGPPAAHGGPSHEEVQLLAELSAAGFDGHIAEHGYRDAEAYVTMDGGTAFLHSYAMGDVVRRRPAKFDGSTVLAGNSVEIGQWEIEGNPPIWRFQCDRKEYEVVEQDLSLNSVEYFIETFVTAKSCGAHPAKPIESSELPAFDGDPSTTERVDVDDPIAAAVAVSQIRYADTASASQVVIARGDVFADALAGSPLTASAPLLLAGASGLPLATLYELERVAAPGAQVYLLGGEAALSADIEIQLNALGYSPMRLAGPTRVETSVAIATRVRELHPDRDELAVARADAPADNPTAAWADSIPGGAWAAHVPTPLVLTPTNDLHPTVAAFAAKGGVTRTYIFGGTQAISDNVASQLPNAVRIAGPDRAATASAAVGLYGTDVTRFTIVNGYVPQGWPFGLAAVGIAADAQAPVLYSQADTVPTSTIELHRQRPGQPGLDTLLIGNRNLLSPTVVQTLEM